MGETTTEDSRHGSRCELGIPRRPNPLFALDVSAAFHTLEPRGARLLQLFKIESGHFKCPCGGTGSPGIARPDVLVDRNKRGHAILGEKREERADVCEVFGVVDTSERDIYQFDMGVWMGRTVLRARRLPKSRGTGLEGSVQFSVSDWKQKRRTNRRSVPICGDAQNGRVPL